MDSGSFVSFVRISRRRPGSRVEMVDLLGELERFLSSRIEITKVTVDVEEARVFTKYGMHHGALMKVDLGMMGHDTD